LGRLPSTFGEVKDSAIEILQAMESHTEAAEKLNHSTSNRAWVNSSEEKGLSNLPGVGASANI